jgi:glutathione S-transferase
VRRAEGAAPLATEAQHIHGGAHAPPAQWVKAMRTPRQAVPALVRGRGGAAAWGRSDVPPYICGENFGAADCIIGHNVIWGRAYGIHHEGGGCLDRLMPRQPFLESGRAPA